MLRPIGLLRRRSRALVARARTRVGTTDWWNVLVEIAVVVLGIVIAFELSEWDQRRQARAEEKQLLRHLREETAADIASILAIRDEHRQSAANYRLLLGAVRDPALAAAYARLGDDGCNLLRLPAVRYHSPQGLEAGERADLITDAELRHLIRAANAERAFNDRQLDYFRDGFDRYSNLLEPFLVWRPAQSGTFDCRVDIARLAADPGAVALLPKAGRDQQRFAEYRHDELVSAQRVANRTACLQDKSCG